MTFKNFIFIGAFALLCFFKGNAQSNAEMRSFDPTFVHTVYFWLHNPDSPEDRSSFETSLKQFLSRSEYAGTNFIGTPPVATREVVDGSFTYSLILSFESAEAQEAYQQEQAHLDFISEASHLWKKVIVYDSMGISE
jgi:hypothetical protein